MGANYDTEVDRQKKGDFTANTVLPILAALETIATAKASRGQNVGTSTLGLIKDTQSRREAALERAARADDAAFNKNLNIAESVRASKRLGMDEAEAKRRSATWEDADKEAQEKANTRKATIDRLLGIPNEYDEKTNTVTRSGVPGVPDLTEEDKAAIHADPIAWLTYRLKPQAVTYITGANGTVYEAPKTGGAAKVVKTEDGAPIVGQPKPVAGAGQPKAPAGYRYTKDGALEVIPGGPADKPNAGKPPTEDMTKSANFARRMELAMHDLNEVAKTGYDPTTMENAARSSKLAPNEFNTREGQRWTNAQMNFVRANLRKESGAVIGPQEMADEIRTYFPVRGDLPDVVEQKARLRAQAFEGMKAAAGAQFEKIPSQIPVKTINEAVERSVAGIKAGTVWRKGPDGKEYEYNAETKKPTGKVR